MSPLSHLSMRSHLVIPLAWNNGQLSNSLIIPYVTELKLGTNTAEWSNPSAIPITLSISTNIHQSKMLKIKTYQSVPTACLFGQTLFATIISMPKPNCIRLTQQCSTRNTFNIQVSPFLLFIDARVWCFIMFRNIFHGGEKLFGSLSFNFDWDGNRFRGFRNWFVFLQYFTLKKENNLWRKDWAVVSIVMK